MGKKRPPLSVLQRQLFTEGVASFLPDNYLSVFLLF